MEENKNKKVEELDDDALENAAGGAASLGRGRKDPGSGVSDREVDNKQNNDN